MIIVLVLSLEHGSRRFCEKVEEVKGGEACVYPPFLR